MRREERGLVLHTRCCIAGGGPAGLMLGLLLARNDIEVVVLEKHADFLRDFRGDTIHPSTLEVMDELGVLDRFLRLPHQRVHQIRALVGDTILPVADFSHLPTRCRFIAFMPQWDFLNFVVGEASGYPAFSLRMETEATDLLEVNGRIAGVHARTGDQSLEVRADLVVAADGRSSLLRERAGLDVLELGAPMDVLWFRLSRRPVDPSETMGRFDRGQIFVLINRGEHWQCGYVIPKDTIEEIRRAGLAAFRKRVAALAPFAVDRVGEIGSWDDVKLLTVRVDRARQWYRPGFLCIGDAAHAMSPIGGVGINLAIQDAVAAANILGEPLRAGSLATAHLHQVQRRRELPTRITQRIQVAIQNRVIGRVLVSPGPLAPPFLLRLLARVPLLRRIPGRLVGLGIRPEHVRRPPRGGRAGQAVRSS
jgi:2-polyprenyl-6-methoxyphenol hydroxylase-like FAD-dependent oxidoreductase